MSEEIDKNRRETFISLPLGDFNDGPISNLLSELQSIQSGGGNVSISIDCHECSSSGWIELSYARKETDDEVLNRLEQDINWQKKERERELRELARLKAKYETGN